MFIDVSNWWNMVISVPFEEDDKDPGIWFLDHNYHESMYSMFKRINGINIYSFASNFYRKLLLASGY